MADYRQLPNAPTHLWLHGSEELYLETGMLEDYCWLDLHCWNIYMTCKISCSFFFLTLLYLSMVTTPPAISLREPDQYTKMQSLTGKGCFPWIKYLVLSQILSFHKCAWTWSNASWFLPAPCVIRNLSSHSRRNFGDDFFSHIILEF